MLNVALMARQQNPAYGARMTRATNLSVPQNADTVVTFDYVEFDTSGTQIASAGSGRLVAPVTGLWTVSATLTYITGSAQSGQWFWGAIARNGNLSDLVGLDSSLAYNGGYYTSVCPSAVIRLAAGDYVSVYADQSSGGAVNLGASQTSFSMGYIGPA